MAKSVSHFISTLDHYQALEEQLSLGLTWVVILDFAKHNVSFYRFIYQTQNCFRVILRNISSKYFVAISDNY